MDLVEGRCDASLTSEPLEIAVAAAKAAGKEIDPATLKMHEITTAEIVFVVHPSNPVETLTLAQIKDMHTGKIANWQEVGGPNMAIAVFTDAPTGGTRAMIKKVVLNGEEYGAVSRPQTAMKVVAKQPRLGLAGDGMALTGAIPVSVSGAKAGVLLLRLQLRDDLLTAHKRLVGCETVLLHQGRIIATSLAGGWKEASEPLLAADSARIEQDGRTWLIAATEPGDALAGSDLRVVILADTAAMTATIGYMTRAAAQRSATGELEQQLSHRSGDEVGELDDSFRELLGYLRGDRRGVGGSRQWRLHGRSRAAQRTRPARQRLRAHGQPPARRQRADERARHGHGGGRTQPGYGQRPA